MGKEGNLQLVVMKVVRHPSCPHAVAVDGTTHRSLAIARS